MEQYHNWWKKCSQRKRGLHTSMKNKSPLISYEIVGNLRSANSEEIVWAIIGIITILKKKQCVKLLMSLIVELNFWYWQYALFKFRFLAKYLFTMDIVWSSRFLRKINYQFQYTLVPYQTRLDRFFGNEKICHCLLSLFFCHMLQICNPT